MLVALRKAMSFLRVTHYLIYLGISRPCDRVRRSSGILTGMDRYT